MGWASASGIFDTVADSLIEAGADDAIKRAVCTDLIRELRDGDWDTCDESLEAFAGDPAIVQAFRDCGVYEEYCQEPHPERGYCELEAGHDGDHKDRGKTWPRSVG